MISIIVYNAVSSRCDADKNAQAKDLSGMRSFRTVPSGDAVVDKIHTSDNNG